MNKNKELPQEVSQEVTQEVTQEVSSNVIDMTAVSNQLSSALTIDTAPLFTKLENGTEIIQKEYTLVNPVGKKEKVTVYDMELIQDIETINSALYGKDILSFVICKKLAKINASDKLKKYGFSSIAEYGKAFHGFESSTVNHYVKIGNSFINDDYTIKTGLPKLGVSHLIELNSLVAEDGSIDAIINLYVNGDLADGMSTKVMREVVKRVKSGATLEDKSATTSDTQEPSATVEKTETPSQSSTPVNEVINLEKSFDNKVAIGQILAHCNSIQAIVEIMKRNDIFTDGIDACLKMLVEDTQRML